MTAVIGARGVMRKNNERNVISLPMHKHDTVPRENISSLQAVLLAACQKIVSRVPTPKFQLFTHLSLVIFGVSGSLSFFSYTA
jgi:hypothetical protein